MNTDPAVMRYISGRPLTLEETLASIERVKQRWAMYGFSWWSLIELASGQIVGAGCIQHLARDPANPLEIGWRLRNDRWRHGLAFEAAERMAAFAFETLDTPLLCAVCESGNVASASLMKKLGMRYRGLQHWYDQYLTVYEISRGEWLAHVGMR
jgi:RimJ/RimL family protein N-acetyltransferase